MSTWWGPNSSQCSASRVTCKCYCHCEGRALQDLYFSTSLHKHLKTEDKQAKKITIPRGFCYGTEESRQ